MKGVPLACREALFRASILARARFIEDMVVEQAGRGVGQYVPQGDPHGGAVGRNGFLVEHDELFP